MSLKIVKSSHTKAMTTTVKSNRKDPEWNESFDFYLDPTEENILGKHFQSKNNALTSVLVTVHASTQIRSDCDLDFVQYLSELNVENGFFLSLRNRSF